MRELIKKINDLNIKIDQGFIGNPLSIHTDGSYGFNVDYLSKDELKELSSLIGKWDSTRQRHIRKGTILERDELLSELSKNLKDTIQ